MADIQPFAGMNQETTQSDIKALADSMLYFATAILEKLPMLTNTDAAMVNVMNTVPVSGTLTTVTTVTNVTNIANLNGLALGASTGLIPYNLSASPFHIYNNIQVS